MPHNIRLAGAAGSGVTLCIGPDRSTVQIAVSLAMTTYRFQIGQTVFLSPSLSQNVTGGAYIVTKKLPERHGEFEYRVKSAHEAYERVVRESELTDSP